MQKIKILTYIIILGLAVPTINAQETGIHSAFNGEWIFDEGLSDDTDKQVEKTIKKAGGRATKKKGKGRYKGGPEEQAIYDHISYDEILTISYKKPEFRLTYDEGFNRVFHTDGRGRSVSASGNSTGDNKDFSFASWVNENKFIVESRPRDGGRIAETYSLSADGSQMTVELHLEPRSFMYPIEIIRVYKNAENNPALIQKGDKK
jgi:hypothetical protein